MQIDEPIKIDTIVYFNARYEITIEGLNAWVQTRYL
jgi:hypothetical protein